MTIRRRFQTVVSFFVLGAAFYGASAAISPDPDATPIAPDRGAAGLSHLLRQLQTRGSLLMITAHPDDEDGGMLAYETRGQGARAALLTLTRGEGGQNVMSGDLYDALGLVRTQELLLADRYMAVDQYFSRAIDYGFSKTREEALEKWTHDRVLSDAVRVVRMVRPLVVTSVFVGAPTDGHGHHQVAGELAQEVFAAAGDPTKFPEQIREGLRPWSPLKVYARVPIFQVTKEGMYDYAIDKFVPVRFFDYVTQKWSDAPPAMTMQVQEGVADPVTGLTYLQVAREGLGFQRSQNGGGTVPRAAPFLSQYHLYASRVAGDQEQTSFFDGIDASVNGIAELASGDKQFLKDGLARISKLASGAMRGYSVDHPAEIAPTLAEGLRATRELMAQVKSRGGNEDVVFELSLKEDQFQKALAAALEIALNTNVANAQPAQGRGPQSSTEAAFTAGRAGFAGRGSTPTFTIAIPGQAFNVEASVYRESGADGAVKLESMNVEPTDGKNWDVRALTGSQDDAATQFEQRFMVKAPEDAALTRPYYSRPDEEQPYYDLDDARYRNLPAAPYPLAVRAKLSYRGVPFEIAQVVQTAERIPGIGLVENPLLIGPAISVTISPRAGAVPIRAKSFDFTCLIHSNVKGPAQGAVHLRLPQGWRSDPSEAAFSFARDGEDKTVVFSVSPDQIKPVDYMITAVAEYNGRSFTEGYHLAGYPGLRPYPYYRPATYKAVGVDVKTAPSLTVGFLPGTGDDVPKALEDLGVNVRILAASDVTHGNLSGYDAIVLGTRAYAVRTELKAANVRLMDYVKNGGVLIVQYQLQDFDRDYGPFPFTLGSNPQKVVDESSPVTLLDPANPAFAWPNKITAADFKNWVEERGHGFMREWDSRYTPLVETHDPEQDPQKGGLLLARYGRGFYVYDAFALYRQLPSGVPGAYRIFANLVSLGKNPEWK